MIVCTALTPALSAEPPAGDLVIGDAPWAKRLNEAVQETSHDLHLDLEPIAEVVFEEDAKSPNGWKRRIDELLASADRVKTDTSAEVGVTGKEPDPFALRLHAYLYRRALEVSSDSEAARKNREEFAWLASFTGLIPSLVDHPFEWPEECRRELAARPTASGPEYALPSVAEMNTPRGKARLASGAFDLVYRGCGWVPEELPHRERLAIRTLLEDPEEMIASTRIWDKMRKGRERGLTGRALLEWALAAADIPGIVGIEKRTGHLTYLLDNAPRDIDLNLFNRVFLFVSGNYRTSCLYGRVIFVIAPTERRGLDVNSYLREYFQYYRTMPKSQRFTLKSLWVNQVADLDEYVLASHIPPREIVACDIRGEAPALDRRVSLTLLRPGPLLRRYLKRWKDGRLWLDVLDRDLKLLGHLTAEPEAWPGETPSASAPPAIAGLLENLTVDGHPVRWIPGVP